MHNNFYFLRHVSSRLHEKLKGFTLVSCFSQNRDELVFEFNNATSSVFIRADLRSDFSCLTFPETFNRARKNSIDLFNDLLMKQVHAVRQFENERAFSIELEEDWSVIFKMHGNMSNVLVAQKNQIEDIFKKRLQQDMNLEVNKLDRQIDFSKEAFLQNQQRLKSLYFTFGERVWSSLQNFEERSLDERWNVIQYVRKELEAGIFYVVRDGNKFILTLLSGGKGKDPSHIRRYDDPYEAVNSFYGSYVAVQGFEKERAGALRYLRGQISQTEGWIEKTGQKLSELRNDEHYKQWGDLVMANMHAIPGEAREVILDDFYNEGAKVTIRLDPQLSAQKNAERFYRKGKNQQIEITKLTAGFNKRVKQLEKLKADLMAAENASDVKALRALRIPTRQEAAEVVSLPFREVEFKGFRIWIGRDARSNDELTMRYSYKEDLWLHVRDDTGSHVLLKYQANKPFPKDVIERAASLAAFFSKRKSESLCAVIVTPKKFVRKRKGDPPGAVVVEREEVILVEPKPI